MKPIILLAVLLLISIAPGCSPVKVQFEYDPAEDFSAYKTFDFMPVPPEVAVHLRALQPAQNAVTKQLEAKGFEGTADNPDLLIAIHTRVTAEMATQDWGCDYPRWALSNEGTEARGGCQVNVYQKTEGRLILDVIKAEDRTMIWRGIAERAIPADRNAEDLDKIVSGVVAKVLKSFPPAK